LDVVTAPAYDIPFNRVSIQGNEQTYITQAIASGHLAGDGEFTRRCSDWLEQRFGVPRVLVTPSCTHALDLAALLLEIETGDEVIVPSFTFSSTANAFALRGARIVFADIRADTLNLDERLVEQRISPRTRAIVPVHYAGVACEMNQIGQLAATRGIAIVEDNAQGLFGSYQGRPLGTFGTFGALSFHETKNVSCGEGGALLINDAAYIERAEILREKGTNRAKYFRGQLDKYTWVDIGSSYLGSELQAAYLFGQLEAADAIQRKRAAIWNTYADGLADWAADNDVRLPCVPAHCSQAYHMFYLIMPSLDDRQRLIAYLAESGVLAVFHYVPLHLSAMGQRFGAQAGDCPVTEEYSDRLLRLPFFNDLQPGEQRRVIDRVRAFRC
jgi:dTDP-4-amino-4,6-dideoxygalactose transaminase